MLAVAPLPFKHFLPEAAATARHWLFDAALPLWWERGADHIGGGFHEKLNPRGLPVGRPTRVRVQSRQVFVYARAGALGWSGPWRQAMHHGLHFMLASHQREDGFFSSTLDTADDNIDLYDQAFVLFALAHAWQADGEPPELLATARRLMAKLDAVFKLEGGGYRASWCMGRPAGPGGTERRSNPLMHLLEALLAWVSAGVEGDFREKAAALTRLALDHLIDPDTGALTENFNDNWIAIGNGQTRIYEPGHQFEWAWLLLQAQQLLDGSGIPDTRAHAGRLERFGRHYGIDATRSVAIFSVSGTGLPLDRRARIWAQTERLRTSLRFAQTGVGTVAANQAAAMQSFQTLLRFLDTPQAGLWHEWMDEDGQFEAAPSPATSLYHLMTGFESLLTLAGPA